MKRSRYNLVETIITEKAAVMNAASKAELEERLLDSLSGESHINLFFFKMNKKLMLGVLGVFALAVVSGGVYMAVQNKVVVAKYDKVEAQAPESDSGDAAMKIAVDDHESLSDAMESLSFTPLNLSRILDGKLAAVQTARSFDGSKSDYLYLTFVKEDGKEFFNMTQSKMSQADFIKPEGGQEVSLNIDGESVTGYYVQYDNSAIDPNSEMALYEQVFVADSSLSLYFNGLYVDISEYAGLTVEDMSAVAESLSK
jgi:hypothetical protein